MLWSILLDRADRREPFDARTLHYELEDVAIREAIRDAVVDAGLNERHVRNHARRLLKLSWRRRRVVSECGAIVSCIDEPDIDLDAMSERLRESLDSGYGEDVS